MNQDPSMRPSLTRKREAAVVLGLAAGLSLGTLASHFLSNDTGAPTNPGVPALEQPHATIPGEVTVTTFGTPEPGPIEPTTIILK